MRQKFGKVLGLIPSLAADFRSVSWGVFCAGSIINTLPLTVVYLVFQKYIVSGLTAGGVKG